MPDAYRFNAREVEPSKPRDSFVPPGWYRACVTESATKKNAAGTGKYIELTWVIVDGPHAKWHIWDRLNVENPSKTAQDIAREALSAICHAVGVLDLENTGQLHGKVCLIKVAVEKKPDYPEKNIIKGYLEDGADTSKYGVSSATITPKAKVGAGASGAVRGAAVARTMDSPPLADDDDDIPF